MLSSKTGPSFPVTIKIIATLLMLCLLMLGVKVYLGSPNSHMRWELYIGALLPIGVCFLGYVGILKSTTTITHEKIVQSWIFPKTVYLKDISQIKLIHMPHFEWVVIPRVIVRSNHGVQVFQTAHPDVLAAFKLLAYGIKNPER